MIRTHAMQSRLRSDATSAGATIALGCCIWRCTLEQGGDQDRGDGLLHDAVVMVRLRRNFLGRRRGRPDTVELALDAEMVD